MLKIRFRIKESWDHGTWHEQECVASSIEQCKRTCGIDDSAEFEVIAIEEVI